jgi:hypothetical protein
MAGTRNVQVSLLSDGNYKWNTEVCVEVHDIQTQILQKSSFWLSKLQTLQTVQNFGVIFGNLMKRDYFAVGYSPT